MRARVAKPVSGGVWVFAAAEQDRIAGLLEKYVELEIKVGRFYLKMDDDFFYIFALWSSCLGER